MPTTDLDWVLIRDRRQGKRDIADSVGRCAEVRGKTPVVNLNCFFRELGMRRKPFFSSLCSSTSRFPTLENNRATTIVAQFYVT